LFPFKVNKWKWKTDIIKYNFIRTYYILQVVVDQHRGLHTKCYIVVYNNTSKLSLENPVKIKSTLKDLNARRMVIASWIYTLHIVYTLKTQHKTLWYYNMTLLELHPAVYDDTDVVVILLYCDVIGERDEPHPPSATGKENISLRYVFIL